MQFNLEKDNKLSYIVVVYEIVETQLKLSRDGAKNVIQRISYKVGSDLEEAAKIAVGKMESVLSIGALQLINEHEEAWKELLHTGIHLDPTDPGKVLSQISHCSCRVRVIVRINELDRRQHKSDPHHIMPTSYYVNATVYSIMSTSVSTNSERLAYDESKRPESPLLAPEYCYNANPTLHSNSLWKNPSSIQDAIALRDTWRLTLESHGCSGLVNVSFLIIYFYLTSLSCW